MKVFNTKETLSHPDISANPSDQSFWWDVHIAIKHPEYTHIKDGNGKLYRIKDDETLTYEEEVDDK